MKFALPGQRGVAEGVEEVDVLEEVALVVEVETELVVGMELELELELDDVELELGVIVLVVEEEVLELVELVVEL